jgi:hypothetical protein
MERIGSHKDLECEGWFWVRVAHHTNLWRAIVGAGMSFRVLQKLGGFVAEHVVFSYGIRCSMDFVPGSCTIYTGALKEDEHSTSVPELPVV